MAQSIYALPKRLVAGLCTVGPIHQDIADGYFYSISLVVFSEAEVAGFLIEQRLAERSEPPTMGQGLTFKVPARADAASEATFAYTESLPAALAYISRGTVEH